MSNADKFGNMSGKGNANVHHSGLNCLDQKWCHPAAVGGINWHLPGLSNTWFEHVSQTKEEIHENRLATRQYLLETYLDGESDTKKARGTWNFFQAGPCPEEPDAPMVDVCVRIPSDVAEGEKLPVIFDVQGGGWYTGGTYEFFMTAMEAMCKKHHAVVVSFCYRPLVEVDGMQIVNDCHAAYQWMLDNADQIHADTDNIILHGYSAGGFTGLGLVFRLKRYGIKLPKANVIGFAPVDDLCCNLSGNISYWSDESQSFEAFDGDYHRMLMPYYMGEWYADPAAPPELSPNRCTVEDLKDFPPTWLSIAELDSSRDGCLEFMSKFHEANVFCDYHVWGGCNHNTCDPSTLLGKEISEEEHRWLHHAITYDLRRPWLNEE